MNISLPGVALPGPGLFNPGKMPEPAMQKPAETVTNEPSQGDTEGIHQLDEKERAQLEKLKHRDREVKAHEQAHVAAGGIYVSRAPVYDYKTGPDGNKYAVGGEVQIDTSSIPGDPKATAEKMRAVKKAATAPAEPSATDRAVAAAAGMREMKALAEYRKASYEASNKQPDNARQQKNTDTSTSSVADETPGSFSAHA